MALQGEELQVVPDIDSQGDDALKAKPSKDSTSPTNPLTPPDWELKMHQDHSTIKVGGRRPAHRRPGALPIRRISQDARPLTSAEMLAHRHLLQPS